MLYDLQQSWYQVAAIGLQTWQDVTSQDLGWIH